MGDYGFEGAGEFAGQDENFNCMPDKPRATENRIIKEFESEPKLQPRFESEWDDLIKLWSKIKKFFYRCLWHSWDYDIGSPAYTSHGWWMQKGDRICKRCGRHEKAIRTASSPHWDWQIPWEKMFPERAAAYLKKYEEMNSNFEL